MHAGVFAIIVLIQSFFALQPPSFQKMCTPADVDIVFTQMAAKKEQRLMSTENLQMALSLLASRGGIDESDAFER